MTERQTHMTLVEHLDELRTCLLRSLAGLAAAMAVCLVFAGWGLRLLQRPYVIVMTRLGQPTELRVLSATAGFMMYMKVALIAGLIVASPWIFYQVWTFVAAGLYPREKRLTMRAVPFSAGLFVAGAMFFLLVVAVPIMEFFLRFNQHLGLRNDLTLNNHVNMMISMMLIFGLAFQLPVAVGILTGLGVIEPETFARHRRYVIVGLFVLAALVTSPSPVDQVLLALPMWGLFELSVWVARLRKRTVRS